jgi:inhibitor of KinA
MIDWQIRPLGEAALLIEAAPADLLANRAVLALAQALDAAALPGAQLALPTVSSLLLRFDPLRTTAAALEAALRELLLTLTPLPAEPTRILRVPVSYGGEHGPDLLDVAQQLGLTPQQVVAEHCAPIYRVLLIGFSPGFPYIGPLPARLYLPRRTTPRTAVPAGSVAIAVEFTGIYPARLPGGWHLLGRTSLRLFDPAADPPTALAPGDGVQFTPQPDGIMP